MLTFLVWAAVAYVAIWVAAAVFFYRINRAFCVAEAASRARDMRTAAFLGAVWPVVLVQLAWLAWQGYRARD